MTESAAHSHSSTADPRPESALDSLANAYVERLCEIDPFLATNLGAPGHDHEVADYSPAGIDRHEQLTREILQQIDQTEDVDDVDAVTRAAMKERLQLSIETTGTRLGAAQVNNLASVLQSRDILDLMPTETAEDWENITARMAGFRGMLAGWGETLREAAATGALSSRRQLQLAAEQARGYAAKDGFFASFASEAVGSDSQKNAAKQAAADAATGYEEIAQLLEDLTPQAPEDDALGPELYPLASRTFIGDAIDPQETYAWGVEELRRIVDEQEQIAARINEHYRKDGGASVEAARASLNADPERTLHGTEALQQWMQTLSDRAVTELAGTHFDIPEQLRTLECKIARTGSGGIYYTGPSEDFTRPGRMWWDVPAEQTQFATWSETTTVYHEGVPGHHLQVGTQTMQAGSLNRWRALLCWVSGHGEGWALYSERLMQELGYLDDDGDRLGMLDAQRMRAGRVVLDIGLHNRYPMPDGLLGSRGGEWTYESAWEFMAAHWSDPEPLRRFELNRYLGWPGQAPSYKIGQRLWEQLRDQALAGASPQARADGSAVRDFHRRALELGALPLSVLRTALA